MKQILYSVVKALIILAAVLGLQQLIELKTRGFCLQRIFADDIGYQNTWEVSPLSFEAKEECKALLSQPYHFLGAGSECFVFASADNKAVIKFFKLDFLRPVYLHRGMCLEDYSDYANTLSTSRFPLKRVRGIREFRIQRTFHSFVLAYETLQEETGLLYLHLNPTQKEWQNTLVLEDPCGIFHEVDLDNTRFVLQKRAVPIETQLLTLISQQKMIEAQACIDSLLHLILNRCRKGIADRDAIDRNLGCIGMQAVELDVGSFSKNIKMQEPWIYRQELAFATLELKHWLKKHAPPLSIYLEMQVENILRETRVVSTDNTGRSGF